MHTQRGQFVGFTILLSLLPAHASYAQNLAQAPEPLRVTVQPIAPQPTPTTSVSTLPIPAKPTPTPSPSRSPYLPNWFGNGPLGAGAHDFKCGARPILPLNCQVTGCVNGQWQSECDERASECGIPPILSIGCTLVGCTDGQWQSKCD